jgi:YegS/Rv2252/BmrU family lipid kinase
MAENEQNPENSTEKPRRRRRTKAEILAAQAEENTTPAKPRRRATSRRKNAMQTVVILNPKSGSSGEDFHAAVETGLKERAVEYSLLLTQLDKSGGELAREAAEQGATHIIACGGDGTVMSVVNGLGKVENSQYITLSIVPGGTANLLAQALDIPTDTDEAIAVAVSGEDREIDLGRCDEYLFALGLGLGLTERLVSQASTEAKEKIGRWAYAWAMLKELGAQPVNFTIKRDDNQPHVQSGVAIVVANAGEIGGQMKFAPDAKMDDGLLDVCILHRFYVRDVVRLLWSTLLGRVREDRAVSFYQAKRVEILSDPPLDLQIDGEVVDLQTPLCVEVVPRNLKVRVPFASESESFVDAPPPVRNRYLGLTPGEWSRIAVLLMLVFGGVAGGIKLKNRRRKKKWFL